MQGVAVGIRTSGLTLTRADAILTDTLPSLRLIRSDLIRKLQGKMPQRLTRD